MLTHDDDKVLAQNEPREEDRTIPAPERELLDTINDLVEAGDVPRLRRLVADLHPADIASILELLDSDVRHATLDVLDDEILAETVLYLPEEQRGGFLEELGPERIAEIVEDLDTDDATDVISELPDEIAEQVLGRLQQVDVETTADIRELLQYGEETAGGRMTTSFVAVLDSAPVSSAIETIRSCVRDQEVDIYVVYVVDGQNKLVGFVPLQDLVLNRPETVVSAFMHRDVVAVAADEDQELVAQLMQRYDLIAVPVVDAEDRLLGVVTFDDIADIIEQEAGQDIFYLAGVTDEQESPSTPPLLSLRRRLPWLVMNLALAFITSMVVAQFEGTIKKVAVLAALMPIVGGMGGNAAIQSITVMVRSIAVGNLGSGGKVRAVLKEATVGLLNGVIVGLLAGVIVWAMWGKVLLAMLISVALLVNLIIAGLVGSTVPLLLRKLKFDPALSSGPLVTMFTDVCGFLTFLGLATLTLSWLLS